METPVYSVIAVGLGKEAISLISEATNGLGYKLDFIDNTDSALEKISSTLPDIIIIDMENSEFDGLTFLGEIRNNEDLKYIPAILSGDNILYDEIPQKIRESGIYDILSSPLNKNELRIRLEAIGKASRMLHSIEHMEKIEEVQQMTRNVFHALSQPLMAITGQAQLIAMKTDDNDLKKRCAGVVEAVDDMSQQINELRSKRKKLIGY